MDVTVVLVKLHKGDAASFQYLSAVFLYMLKYLVWSKEYNSLFKTNWNFSSL